MQQRIIVCGYPKSGNTWLTRLVAEIVGCPVSGFWCIPHQKEEAIEGLERESDCQCFKAHQSIEQMEYTFKYYANGSEKIIYVIRDPRDIIVSASHYFHLPPHYLRIYLLMSLFPSGSEMYYKLFNTQKYNLDILTRGLLKGIKDIVWLHVPWNEHVMGYLKSDVLIIKYEDLKSDPLCEAKKICGYLNIERSEKKLLESISIQSFDNKKKKFLENNDLQKAKFLRKGKTGEWKEVLSDHNINMINEEIGDFLQQLGY
jgi:hypothetical protein